MNSSSNLNIIKPIYNLKDDENITIELLNDEYFDSINCTLEFRLISTDPDYETFDLYPVQTIKAQGSENKLTYDEFKMEYIGRTSFFHIFLNINQEQEQYIENKEEEEGKEEENEIEKKVEENEEKYQEIKEEEKEEKNEKEKEEGIKEDDIKEYIETEEVNKNEEEIKEDDIKEYIETEEVNKNEIIISDESLKKTCKNEEIIEGKCSDGTMDNEQVEQIYNYLKENILNQNYTGDNTVVETENVIFQISTFEYQKNSMNPNISSIDLGKCESILKSKYNLSDNDSLYIVKTDIKSEDLSSTYVQYEVYHPITKIQLKLDYCNSVKITVNVPVNLDKNTISIYESLSELGYNLFSSSDSFYNDICSTYTSESGTDMTLEDRKKEIYWTNGNISICQSGCENESYNKTTKKAKCNCDVQKSSTVTDISKINFEPNKIADSFLNTLTNSNFLVLKCYKLVLDFGNILKNKGRIIMSIIFLLFIILLFIYIIKDRKKINYYIKLIIKNKIQNNEGQNNKTTKIFKNDNVTKNEKIKKKLNNKKKIKNKSNIKAARKDILKDKVKNINNNKVKNNNNKKGKGKNQKSTQLKNHEPPKKNKKECAKVNKNKNECKKVNKNKNFEIRNSNNIIVNSKSDLVQKTKHDYININIIPISNLNYGKYKKKKKKERKNNIQIYNKHKILNDRSITSANMYNNNEIYKLFNDQELNSLEYELAINLDKRTYFQYYWSLLKKKQLILFTFLPQNDYNLLSIKISLFLLCFSLYFTINGFFFSDDTMHKIHKDNGNYNIIYQIPQIFYSSIVSGFINIILKLLSLSEKNILVLKQIKNIKIANQYSKNIEKCITIKFITFYIISNFLLLFFWFFISCFCAVYTNTQQILIKDTLISFALSMAYPFGLNLISGLFRIPALRDKSKNNKCLYKFSCYIALIL